MQHAFDFNASRNVYSRLAKYRAVILYVAVLILVAVIQHAPTSKTEFFFLLVFTIVGLVNFPGYIIYRAVTPNVLFPWMVVFCLTSAYGLAVIQLLCIVSLSLQLPIEHAIAILVAITFFGIIFVDFGLIWRRASYPFHALRAKSVDIPALGLWILCGLAAYVVGHWAEPASLLGETRTDIATVHLLRYVSDYHNVSPLNGLSPVYPFSGTYYFFALVSALSGMDPIFVLDKSRFFWTMVSTASIYFATYTLKRSRAVAALSFCVCAVFVLFGQFAQIPGFYSAQLAPIAHRAVLAMDVLVPLSIGAILGLSGSNARNIPAYATCLAATQFALLFIHQREYVQVLIYLALFLAVLTVIRKAVDRAMLLLVLVFFAMGIAYKAWYLADAVSTAIAMTISNQLLLRDFTELTFSSALNIASNYVNHYGLYAYGILPLSLSLSFVALVAYRREIRTCAIFFCIAFFILVSSLSILTYPLLILSFDEMLVSPVRHVIFFLYIFFPLGLIYTFNLLRKCMPDVLGIVERNLSSGKAPRFFYRAAESLRTSPGARASGLGVALFATSLLFSLALYLAGQLNASVAPVLAKSPYHFLRGALLLLVAVSLYKYWTGGGNDASSVTPGANENRVARDYFLWILVSTIPLALATTVSNSALIVSMFKNPGPSTPMESAKSYYQQYVKLSGIDSNGNGCKEISAHLLQLKEDIRVTACMPPFEFIQWARRNMRRDAIVLYNPVGLFDPAGFLPQKLAAPIQPDRYRYWEQMFVKFRQSFDSGAKHHPVPFYSDSYESETLRREAAAFLGATHVVVDPGSYRLLMPRMERDRLNGYRVLYDRDHWAVLELI